MGYKHGSGLGREEQGMSMALQVEKTSRRGGKIVHEKDIATKGTVPIDIRGFAIVHKIYFVLLGKREELLLRTLLTAFGGLQSGCNKNL